jgi:hypothetical protein
MIQKHISITKKQDQKLKAFAKKTGLKQSEIFRQSLDSFLDGKQWNGYGLALMSESSLAEDWLSDEDQEAWKDL